MIEVAALMIGDIVQCYSEDRYDNPCEIRPGMFLRKGAPKSLYRPGSSTDVLIFQKGKVDFAGDIMSNLCDRRVSNRFSGWFGDPLVETEVKVRSSIAMRKAETRRRQEQ
jgi:phosphatidylserine decarboxylase